MSRTRAQPSGIRLTPSDAAVVKGMLRRGDRQHDIAAWFGVNGGRIGEIASGKTFRSVHPTSNLNLPPPGPYLSGRDAMIALDALGKAKEAIREAELLLKRQL